MQVPIVETDETPIEPTIPQLAIPTGYHTRDQLIAEFLALESKYPSQVTHQIIGTTVQGRNIYLFAIGNPEGGRVFYTATHGIELAGPEIYLMFAKWLLENKEPGVSSRILRRNLTLIVPHMNMDNYGVTRGNKNGVDLNRNFPATWRTECMRLSDAICTYGGNECVDSKCIYVTSGTGPGYCYPSTCSGSWSDIQGIWCYRGKCPNAPAEYAKGPSEPESQAIINAVKAIKPACYFDYHIWDGPYIAKPSWRARRKAELNGFGTLAEITAAHDAVAQKIIALQTARGTRVYKYYELGIFGANVCNTCADVGALSFLAEGHNYRGPNGEQWNCPFADLESTWFPAFLPIAIGLSQACEVEVEDYLPIVLGAIVLLGLLAR